MNGHLPNEDSDIHPWMPTGLHAYFTNSPRSPVGAVCNALNISIHDREKVYAEMQRVQREINFKTT